MAFGSEEWPSLGVDWVWSQPPANEPRGFRRCANPLAEIDADDAEFAPRLIPPKVWWRRLARRLFCRRVILVGC